MFHLINFIIKHRLLPCRHSEDLIETGYNIYNVACFVWGLQEYFIRFIYRPLHIYLAF